MALKEKLKKKFEKISRMGSPYSPSKNPVARAYKKGVRKNIRRLDERGNKVFTDLEAGADTKRKASEVKSKKAKKNTSKVSKSLRPKARPAKKAEGGGLKAVPEGNKGLKKLPTAVRNKMGYMQKGGSCRGMGKATRGGSYGRMG